MNQTEEVYNENETEQETKYKKNDLPKSEELETYKNNLSARIRKAKTDLEGLSQKREKLFDAYMGEAYGNEVKGRSQIVMSDVSDTIESVMPSLMRIFQGTVDVVNVLPTGDGDTKKAKLMEEALNFYFQRINNGYLIMHDWFKDALLSKPGVVKVYWHESERRDERHYDGLGFMDYMKIVNDPMFEVYETERKVPDRFKGNDLQLQEAAVRAGLPEDALYEYEVKGCKIIEVSEPRIENVAPEDFIFDLRAKTIDKSFCAERTTWHKSEAKKRFKAFDDIAMRGGMEEDPQEKINRTEEIADTTPMMDYKDEFITIYEIYDKYYDEDGKCISIQAFMHNDQIIEIKKNPYGRPPYFDLSAIRLPHRSVGLSLAEMVDTIQKIKTGMMRGLLDNIYFSNDGMKVVNPFRVNLSDLTVGNKPGGLVRTTEDVDPAGTISVVPTNTLPSYFFKVWETVEGARENKTGITRYNQGVNAQSLNRTASGITQIMNAAMARIEAIARLFAETGVKDMFKFLAEIIVKFMKKPLMIQLNKEWKTINPIEIDGSYDILIDIGSGIGSKEYKAQQLTTNLQMYGQLANMLAQAIMNPYVSEVEKFRLANLIKASNIYEMISAHWEVQGFKDTSRFINNPEEITNEAVQQLKSGFGGGPGGAGAGIGGGGPVAPGQPGLERNMGQGGAPLPPGANQAGNVPAGQNS